jgi:hypothetical protein
MAVVCEVCGEAADGLQELADHLVSLAGRSDVNHVMWLNRNVTKHRVGPEELVVLLRRRDRGAGTGEDRVRR